MGVRPQARRGCRTTAPLFEPEEMAFQSTGGGRLRELALRPAPRLTETERRRDEDRRVMDRLREQGADLARRFGLAYKALDPEVDGVTEHYGICYEDGVIRIRLRHARTGCVLKESSLVDTLCHELAHLEHLNHGPKFKRLYLKILNQARDLGYYRPGPKAVPPRQASLFEACGSI